MDEDHVRETDAFVLRVQDLMTKDVVVCSPQQTIQEVAQKMMHHQVSSVIVMEGNQQKGIWSIVLWLSIIRLKGMPAPL